MSIDEARTTTKVSPTASRKVRWFSRRAVLFHLAIVIWFPGCIVACWWQVTVALAGNQLGWLYSVEWPVFAIFGVVGWWQLVHDDELVVRRRKALRQRVLQPATTTEPAISLEAELAIHQAEEEDGELAAYNAYLAGLRAETSEKTWRNPTGRRAH